MNRNLLKEVVIDQRHSDSSKSFVKRYASVQKDQTGNLAEIISGVRRCGKSTLLTEIRSMQNHQDYYINFDDERLITFSIEDFQLLTEVFTDLYGKQSIYYFDEIQNIDGWERYVRRLQDEGNKIYITGSNARMLSRELGTHLTGRYIRRELFPFSFTDFLRLKDVQVPVLNELHGTEIKSRIRILFQQYFEAGGFPVYLLNRNRDYLRDLYEGIVFRDILVRHKITREREIRELLYFIAGNIAKEATQNSLARIVGIKNSTTIKDYLGFFEDSFLVFTLFRYDDSIKRQLLAPRKLYFIDNALASVVSFRSGSDRGRMLENLVFIELKRRNAEIYYFRGKYECDFVIKQDFKIQIIQVCADLDQAETRNREISGLMEAMIFFDLRHGWIITENDEDHFEKDGRAVEIIPVWKWLLNSGMLTAPG